MSILFCILKKFLKLVTHSEWKKVMRKEVQALGENNTLDATKLCNENKISRMSVGV